MLMEAYHQRKKYEAAIIARSFAKLFSGPEEQKISSDAMMAMLGITPKGA